jgi:hypothetical protein
MARICSRPHDQAHFFILRALPCIHSQPSSFFCLTPFALLSSCRRHVMPPKPSISAESVKLQQVLARTCRQSGFLTQTPDCRAFRSHQMVRPTVECPFPRMDPYVRAPNICAHTSTHIVNKRKPWENHWLLYWSRCTYLYDFTCVCQAYSGIPASLRAMICACDSLSMFRRHVAQHSAVLVRRVHVQQTHCVHHL